MGNVASPQLRASIDSTVKNVLQAHTDISPQLRAQLSAELSNQLQLSLSATVTTSVVANNSLSVLCAMLAFLAFCLVGQANAVIQLFEVFAINALFCIIGTGVLVLVLMRLGYLQPTTQPSAQPTIAPPSAPTKPTTTAAAASETERKQQALEALLAQLRE